MGLRDPVKQAQGLVRSNRSFQIQVYLLSRSRVGKSKSHPNNIAGSPHTVHTCMVRLDRP
jgi:hypothetical protein